MTNGQLLLLADAILFAHFCIAAYLVISLPVIWIGRWLHCRFVHAPWFRYSHAGLMGFVLLESLAGLFCPLTTWEAALRRTANAGTAGDGQSFMAHWVGELLFYDFDETTFTIIYVLFFAAVVGTLFLIPVHHERQEK